MKNKLFETIGWVGMAMILTAYALANFHILSVDSITYQLLNIIGSLGIIIVYYLRRNYKTMVLNIVWIIIGLISLGKLISKF